MKEIKFRLRDRDNKIVGYEKWYSGAWNEEREEWEAHPRWLYSIDNEYWNPAPIPHRHKDQCIDLEDKHWREIYEGDRVNIRRYDRKTWEIGEVQFSNAYFIYFVHCRWDDNKESDYYGVRFEEIHEIEIIGNIYENPELLNGK